MLMRISSILPALLLSFTAIAVGAPQDQSESINITRIDASTPVQVQVKLAMSAAPADVAEKASIFVLGKEGYVLHRKGTNGFSCLVERSRLDTLEPTCYDAEGTATTLKVRFFTEEQRAKGRLEEQIKSDVAAMYQSGKFVVPRKPGIVYMLSDHNYLFDSRTKTVARFPGHLMFYAPHATAETVGTGKGAPFLLHAGEPEALMIVVPAAMHY